jgi:hypothetical protein
LCFPSRACSYDTDRRFLVLMWGDRSVHVRLVLVRLILRIVRVLVGWQDAPRPFDLVPRGDRNLEDLDVGVGEVVGADL